MTEKPPSCQDHDGARTQDVRDALHRLLDLIAEQVAKRLLANDCSQPVTDALNLPNPTTHQEDHP